MVVFVLLGVIVTCSCLVSRCKCQAVALPFLYKRLCSPGSDVFYLMKAVKLSQNVEFFKKFCRLFVNVLSEVCFLGVKVMSLKSYYYGTYSENVGNLVNVYGKCLLKLSKCRNHVVFSARCKK